MEKYGEDVLRFGEALDEAIAGRRVIMLRSYPLSEADAAAVFDVVRTHEGRYKQELESRNAELLRRQDELERLQAQIVHSEKMASLGQLAAGVAHELNNPTGFIYGNMEILRPCAAGLERLLSFYETIPLSESLVTRVKAIKEEIDYEAEFKKVDLHEGIESTIRLLSQYYNSGRITPERDYANLPPVDCYAGQLNQVGR